MIDHCPSALNSLFSILMSDRARVIKAERIIKGFSIRYGKILMVSRVLGGKMKWFIGFLREGMVFFLFKLLSFFSLFYLVLSYFCSFFISIFTSIYLLEISENSLNYKKNNILINLSQRTFQSILVSINQ